MSHRRKHVSQSLLQTGCPELGPGQQVLRVVEHRGSNILEARARVQTGRDGRAVTSVRSYDTPVDASPAPVSQTEDDTASRLLVRMPSRFNKLLWVKKGAHTEALRHTSQSAPAAASLFCVF
jgi:hypothetical protein